MHGVDKTDINFLSFTHNTSTYGFALNTIGNMVSFYENQSRRVTASHGLESPFL